MRMAGNDDGLTIGVARAIVQRDDAWAGGFSRAKALCHILLDDEACARAFACGDGGRIFDTPRALVEGLRRWIEPADRVRAGDSPARPVAERFDDRVFVVTVPRPGGDIGLKPALGGIGPIAGAPDEGPQRFYRTDAQRLEAAGRVLYSYVHGTWIEGADPHALRRGDRCPAGEDPLGIAGIARRGPEPPSAVWIADVAGHLGRLRAGRYLAALIAVAPLLHPAEGPSPFWEPTARDDEDDDEDDEGDEPEIPPSLGAPFYVARAAADDVAIALLPVFTGMPEERAALAVAYAWPRPIPGDLWRAYVPRPQPVRLYAAVFAGEGALLRASRGGPPASVLCIAPSALIDDDQRLARAFSALGAVPIP